METFKLQRLPRDAGDFRAWRNAFCTSLSSYDRTTREVLTRWIAPAFESRPTEKDRKKLEHSEGFIRLDKHLAAILTEEKHLTGTLGIRIQTYLEKCQKHHIGAKGRVILHMIASEYHLDRQRGAALTQMHLLKITLDGYKVKDLQAFVQNIDKCLNALRRRDRPNKSTMFEFLFDRVKNVQRLHRVIEKIKDSGPRSHRRTFKYLYRKLNESIRDSREEENNTAVQRNLTQHPRAGGAAANPKAKSEPKGDNNKNRDKSRDRSKGRDKSKNRDSSKSKKGDGKGGKGNKGKGKGNGNSNADPKAKAKADAKPPKRDESRPPLTDEQKGTKVCRFWKQGKCTTPNCKFAHTDNPPKIPAGAALAVPAMPGRPRTQKYVVELMGDT